MSTGPGPLDWAHRPTGDRGGRAEPSPGAGPSRAAEPRPRPGPAPHSPSAGRTIFPLPGDASTPGHVSAAGRTTSAREGGLGPHHLSPYEGVGGGGEAWAVLPRATLPQPAAARRARGKARGVPAAMSRCGAAGNGAEGRDPGEACCGGTGGVRSGGGVGPSLPFPR